MGLDTVLLVCEVEEQFEINIPNEDAAEVITVRVLAVLVTKLKNETAAEQISYDDVFAKLVDIVSRETGVEPEKISETTRFIEDLKMD